MSKVKELERQLAEAKKEEATKGVKEWENKVRGIIGKYYKRVRCLGYNNKVNTNHLSYVKIRGLSEISKEKDVANVVIQPMYLAITPVGWTRREGKLRYKNNVNSFRTSRIVERDVSKGIESGKMYQYDRTNVYSIDDHCVQLGYSRGESWIECSKEEFEEVEKLSNELSLDFYNKLIPYCETYENKEPFTIETEQMIPNIDEAALKRIDDLISSNVDINLLINTLSGKVAKYNYFNGTILSELAQYNMTGPEKGLNLDIQPGNEGTDYEPYTTRYDLIGVSIDWCHILYPIRTKLSCGIHELAEKLSKLSSVYNRNNWECSYDTRSYDAVFSHAKLLPAPLAEVNALINKNIK